MAEHAKLTRKLELRTERGCPLIHRGRGLT